jgi:predicted nucleic acid-binding protein
MALIVLDAGVVIGFLDAEDVHHASARRAISGAYESSDSLVLPVSAYAEVLVAPSTKGVAAVRTVDSALEKLRVAIEVATPSIAKRAAMLRAKFPSKLRLPDALVIATAENIDADRILTTDRGWPKVSVAVDKL